MSLTIVNNQLDIILKDHEERNRLNRFYLDTLAKHLLASMKAYDSDASLFDSVLLSSSEINLIMARADANRGYRVCSVCGRKIYGNKRFCSTSCNLEYAKEYYS